jgi:5-methyltetrahydrofolate--homocysteine methyltransferase
MGEEAAGGGLMRPLRARLGEAGAILADGAMGTMLFQRGLRAGDCPERWSLEEPGILEEISAAYLAAGAEILETNTFGASPMKLAPYHLQDRTEEVNARAVACARKAARDRAYVAASVGPSGRILEPYGDASRDEVAGSYRRQMKVLISEGVDLICIETMTDLAEAVLAVEAARSVSTTLPVCATLTFDPTPRGFFTLMGASIEQAARQLEAAGADVLGSNCGNGIRDMAAIAEEFLKATTLPVLIQSNAGLPEMKEGAPVFPESPESLARESRRMLTAGVKIIGGCCGTTPLHVAALREVLDAFGSSGAAGP